MAYLDRTYYLGDFGGSVIPEEEFGKLAETASHIIDVIVTRPVDPEDDAVRLAAAYQADMLWLHGSPDAEAGITVALGGYNEKLGDYSVGNNRVNTSGRRIMSVGGIPVSGLTVALLRKRGYMNRCVYNEAEA